MKGRNTQQEGHKRKYEATNDSPDVRNTVGAIYAAMKRLGYERDAREKVLSEAGFAYPERTMRRYVERIEADDIPVPSPGTAGRKRALTPEEERIFCGWVLAENERNEKVDLSASQAFVEHSLGTKMSKPTVQRMLHRLGFSSRVMQTSRAGYKLDKDEILEMATNWLNARTDAGFFNVHPSELGSIDFTFTSQRTYRPRSYARRGG
jgi:transposase